MRLFVIRHGQTEFNKKGLIQGNIDSQLTALGQRQSILLANELKNIMLDNIFSSTASRAYDTALPLAHFHRLPVVKVPNFREREYGTYEGKSLGQAKSQHPEMFSDAPTLDLEFKPEGGESIGDVSDRVSEFMQRLTSHLKDKTVAVVAHGIVNKIIIAQLVDGSLGKMGSYKQGNCCINELIIEDKKARAVRLNYKEHLSHL